MASEKFNTARNALQFSQGILDKYRVMQFNQDHTGFQNPLEQGKLQMGPQVPGNSILQQNQRMDLNADRTGVMNPLDVGKLQMENFHGAQSPQLGNQMNGNSPTGFFGTMMRTKIPTIDNYQARLPITQAAIGGFQKARDFIFGQKAETPAQALEMGQIPVTGPSGNQMNLDPFGMTGAIQKVGGVTLKSLKRLAEEVKTPKVSKQYLMDLSNRPDIKQPERDLLRRFIEEEGDEVDTKQFSNKVKSELLPLKPTLRIGGTGQYESITLPDELRGPVANYDERIYESPIKTSGGDVHFRDFDVPNYFAHSRIEDLPPSDFSKRRALTSTDQLANEAYSKTGDTRRVIELQSDLFQKGRLESEAFRSAGDIENPNLPESTRKLLTEDKLKRDAEMSKLESYRNTWHERVIREEVKQAAKDGKTKLQFPVGETAMKIEGLGETHNFTVARMIGKQIAPGQKLDDSTLKVGQHIYEGGTQNSPQWIITDVLGDGKFKAVPKNQVDNAFSSFERTANKAEVISPELVAKYGKERPSYEDMAKNLSATYGETFDISGKIDTENPIYRFYEKEVGRYLTNKYKARRFKDAQGVEWYEIDVPKEAGKAPVEAFGAAPFLNDKEEE